MNNIKFEFQCQVCGEWMHSPSEAEATAHIARHVMGGECEAEYAEGIPLAFAEMRKIVAEVEAGRMPEDGVRILRDGGGVSDYNRNKEVS